MKKLKFIYILPLLLSMAGCEKIIEFDQGNILIDGITINALAVSDTVFTASISKAFPFYSMKALEGDVFWIYDGSLEGQYEQLYKDSALIKDAIVQLSVNDTQQYKMTYDSDTYTYKSTYIPKGGDRLMMSVESIDFPIAKSEIQIPHSQKIEIISYEKTYSPNNDRIVEGDMFDYMGQDTIARITLKIYDPAQSQNFYRLKVRGYALSYYDNGDLAYMHNDIYTSEDAIFKDVQLDKGYRGWPAYFSNVFSDQLFNGKEYEFTVESRLRKGDPGTNHMVVELQSITKELYYYLKSTMLYRITPQDAYTEPILIYSNIENGWGILGGVNTDRHVILL